MNDSHEDSSTGFWKVFNIVAVCAMVGSALYVVGSHWPRRGVSCVNACINNLRQMDGAAQQWALENKKKLEDKVTWKDITPYLKNPIVCPQNGIYTIGPTVSNVPSCSIATHRLPP
ncbi:MAG: hypothetical protein EXS35_08975 [Pedosphaera sp.]|nr:hypothetical protein [Pedosphaera sp.]